MSVVDPYDDDRRRRSHRDRDRRDDREPRYVETQETYVRSPVATAPDPPYIARTTEIVRRPVREDSDLSIEEVRRDFPPPAGAYAPQRTMVRDDRYGPPVRSRSAERGSQYGGYLRDPRYSDRDQDDRRSRKSQLYAEQEIIEKPRRRSLSRNQKIIAAVGGAALAVGGKELWDRKQADGRPVARNPLATAAVGAAGALAGYEGVEYASKHTELLGGGQAKEKKKTYVAHQGRDGKVAEYYSSDEESVKSSRPKKSRRKSIVEGALGLAGIGAAAKAADSGGRRSGGRSRRGSDSDYDDRRSSRGRDREPEGAAKFQQAAKAALLAGATEAFRVRNEPGGWAGDKGKRILTAAIGAGGIDAAADRDPDKHGKRHILEAVVGGLAGNRLINGSRNNIEDERGSIRSGRSRSRARSSSRGPRSGGTGPLAALATAGIGALAGKQLLDRSRSRSRATSRRRRDSPDSYDSRSPSPRRGGKDRHKRSKSVTDYARNGLAAMGIGEAVKSSRDRSRSRDRGNVEYEEETRVKRRTRRRDDDRGGSDDGYGRSAGRSRRSGDYDERDRGDPYGDPRYADSQSSAVGSRRGGGKRSARQKDGQKNRRIAEGKDGDGGENSDSSLGSSSEDEKRVKKMKGKQLLTAGLATVATIHAAHNVYQSMEKRDARHKAVAEGEMTPEEARKLKAKATLQDVASIGIAALGIKGAVSEIKEANEMRHEYMELREKKEERHKKRLERLAKGSKSPSNSSSKESNGGGRRRKDDNYAPSSYGGRDGYGPRYIDDNPYNTGLPAPPVGYNGR